MSDATPSADDKVRELLATEAGLRELLATHQELSRAQGNRIDDLSRDLGETQAKLRAAQQEIVRLNTMLSGYRRNQA